jgi:3-phosphoshikimate 1-carboxyvinyltransferase
MAVGETRITGLLEGQDVLDTAKAMRAFGATVTRHGEGAWTVNGVGVGGFRSLRMCWMSATPAPGRG